MCDNVFHRYIVYLLQVAPDVMSCHLNWYMELHHIRWLGFTGLDNFHEEIRQEHPKLGVPMPIEWIPENYEMLHSQTEEN